MTKYLLVLVLAGSTTLQAQLRLPHLVSDGMVLQRDTQVKLWGWASPGEPVNVQFIDETYITRAADDGTWEVQVPTPQAGGPFTLRISAVRQDTTILIRDVLVGDVWLCSGQSNMVHHLGRHQGRYATEIAAASYPEIRQYAMPTAAALYGEAQQVPKANWEQATSDHILNFSVVAYFFAKKLYDQYGIPIGLINASVGGSPIETWISEEGLKDFPHLLETVQTNKDTAYVNRVNREAAALRQELAAAKKPDKGLSEGIKWYDPAYVPKNWKTINIPGYWEDQGIKDLDGTVWYRRTVNIPASMTGKAGHVALGRIVDADELYINGVSVGRTTYQYPQRRYQVPADLLKPGENVFVIRVQNYGGKGGFVPDKPYYLAVENDTLDLKGYWQYKVGEVFERPPRIKEISMRHQPVSFFNGMIAPIAGYALTGTLWYQGESNAGRPQEYRDLMPALITDWRNQWNHPNMPFLYVQLPNYMEVSYSPTESNWAELREAQLQALEVPNTAMTVAIDLGEWNDIHPGKKKPIGDRLALAAQSLVYGEKDIVYSGPLYKSHAIQDNKVILTFDHTGSGLVSKDGEALRWFAVAGADKQFFWANATIEDNKVTVWNEQVPDPVAVRYAWADNPDQVNFYNKEGLPASPFRTDTWESK